MSEHFGKTEPRLWTKPLRELTPETSLGFEVIDFAREILGITLRPWQEWLLIHALELLPDGQYRFRKVIVLVARQNGKTLLASVLAAWWLYVDSQRHPDRVPPVKFKVVGVAQNLDIAREPWASVKTWVDPEPDTPEEADLAVVTLQAATAKVSDTNGKEAIFARSRAHYEIRAAESARGKPAARVLMDELREQRKWDAWNAVSQTTKSFWSGQLWGISNAGDAGAIVLKTQRDAGLESISAWEQKVIAGLMDAEAFAAQHDVSIGLFEWSAPEGCAPDDVDGILQANPSIGYGAITVQSVLSDMRTMTDAGYRTEVLCQWVTALVDNYIAVKEWRDLHVEPAKLLIPKGARTVWGVDVSIDRTKSWISAAVFTESGVPFVTVRTAAAGNVWPIAYLTELAEMSGQREVALQGQGSPSVELAEPLKKAGLIVHALDRATCAIATGRIRDRVRDRRMLIIPQPDVEIGIEGGIATKYAEHLLWSRDKSMPVDIAGVCAETWALYALEVLKPEPKKKAPPPPRAAVITADQRTEMRDDNLVHVQF